MWVDKGGPGCQQLVKNLSSPTAVSSAQRTGLIYGPNSSHRHPGLSEPASLSHLRFSSQHFVQVVSPHSCRQGVATAVYDPSRSPGFSLEDADDSSLDIAPSPPPTDGRINIEVNNEAIRTLDLSAAHSVLRPFVAEIGNYVGVPERDPKELLEKMVGFIISYEWADPLDPREVSEMPDVRLWFVRLDAAYPWLPAVLDWRAGELARYAAMLVPHQMSKRHGLVFNPEALELWTMKKFFIVYDWLQAHNVGRPDAKVKGMMNVLGFTISENLYELVEKSEKP